MRRGLERSWEAKYSPAEGRGKTTRRPTAEKRGLTTDGTGAEPLRSPAPLPAPLKALFRNICASDCGQKHHCSGFVSGYLA